MWSRQRTPIKENLRCIEDNNYVTTFGLKRKRNWSDSMIKILLGEPDKMTSSPYSKAQPAKLYLLDRILKAESTVLFSRMQECTDENIEIEIRKWAENVDIKYDFASSSFKIPRPEHSGMNLNGKKRKVNYLRHHCTSYDNEISKIRRNHDGKHYAYYIIKARILKKIAENFPSLEEEANSQLLLVKRRLAKFQRQSYSVRGIKE